jgi:hypothetical protein
MLLPIKATLAITAATAVADRTPYVDLPSLIVVVFIPNTNVCRRDIEVVTYSICFCIIFVSQVLSLKKGILPAITLNRRQSSLFHARKLQPTSLLEDDGIASRVSADIASSIASLLQLICATGKSIASFPSIRN